MYDQDPASYNMITYFWVAGLSVWGGVASYIRKVKSGVTSRFSFTELVGELVTSALAGVLTFYLCELASLPQLMSAIFIAVSGHMGANVILLFEKQFENFFQRFTGSNIKKD